MSIKITLQLSNAANFALVIHWLPCKVLELAAKAGGVVPGKLPQGKLPPRKPGDEEKIAKRTGQSSNSNGNGKTMSFYIMLACQIIAYSDFRHLVIHILNLTIAKPLA